MATVTVAGAADEKRDAATVALDGCALGGNVRRKSLLCCGKPRDFTGDVVIVTNPNFDINTTIFKTAQGMLPRAVLKTKLGVHMYWSEKIVAEVTRMSRSLPQQCHINKPIMDFMSNECAFDMEHADDTFMDHLQFVTEYSEKHFAGHSPRVLLLHSIMGVLTNIFPMEMDKLPRLESLCTDFEMVHVMAFPSVQRLLYGKDLVGVLAGHGVEKLKSLESLTFHRVIDNKEMTIDAESLWIHLNYQLIHFLDFLPADNWENELSDGVFPTFIDTLKFLKDMGKLIANVDLDLTEKQSAVNHKSSSLGGFILNIIPNSVRKNALRKSVHEFSAMIKHSLDFKLNWKDQAKM